MPWFYFVAANGGEIGKGIVVVPAFLRFNATASLVNVTNGFRSLEDCLLSGR